VDVVESDGAFEVVVDLPGVTARDVRVLIKGARCSSPREGAVRPARPASATFHLVERGFGRFARAIPLAGATDASRATARFEDGELRIVIRRSSNAAAARLSCRSRKVRADRRVPRAHEDPLRR